MTVGVGLMLQPEQRFLALLDDAIRKDVDYLVVMPETTWIDREDGFQPNGFARAFRALGEQTGLPFVAHGVGLSLGSATVSPERTERWLARIGEDTRTFGFRWYTDHLGMSVVGGREVTLPLPLPMCEEVADDVRRTLARVSAIVGDVGVENVAHHFVLGDPLDEPAFLAACTSGARQHVLLDIHNVFTMATNLGFSAREYVSRLPLDRVIEVHLSGGSESPVGWLPDEATVRLDGHDDAIPEEVWRLFEETLPLCPALRGVTHERMEGTMTDADVPLVREELARIRFLLERAGRR